MSATRLKEDGTSISSLWPIRFTTCLLNRHALLRERETPSVRVFPPLVSHLRDSGQRKALSLSSFGDNHTSQSNRARLFTHKFKPRY